MTDMTSQVQPTQQPDIATMRRALLVIDRLERQLRAERAAATEPVAVIGMACRLPGEIDSPDEYWEALLSGADAVSEVPVERWDAERYYAPEAGTPGKMNTRWGGFLRGLQDFDPEFFGITPREAEVMDPNQRLVLEVTWEALENAGCGRPHGSQTGMYVGTIGSDFGAAQLSNSAGISAYATTGAALSVISGRPAYVLDLRGPAMTIDTACSSSLVAVHLACQALRTREIDMAVAGGVNVLLSPVSTVAAAQFGMTSPTGHCHAFDEAADGFVRSEGCGMVVLKRLSDAQADGDEVLALIRGSAVNQDGRSTGLTAPNVESQKRVIAQALRASRVSPEEVSYIEAHGTGTPLGDPIEAEALAEVYPASGDPWYLGSVKSNLGHTEGAAGVASLIKVILGMRHGVIPPQLHFSRLSPNIALDSPPFEIAVEPTPWPSRGGRRIAGINGFGLSGTNVHMLVEEAPAPNVAPPAPRSASVLALSARSPEGLAATVRTHTDWLREHCPDATSYCAAVNRGRMDLPCRVAVVGTSAADLVRELERTLEAPPAPAVRREARVAFVLREGLGGPVVDEELYGRVPAYRAAIDECLGTDRGKDGRLPVSVRTFAVLYASARMAMSLGVQPVVLAGEGVGEVAGACLGGALSVNDGLRIAEHLGSAEPLENAELEVAPPASIPLLSGRTGEVWPWDRTIPTEHWRALCSDPASRHGISEDGLTASGADLLLDLATGEVRAPAEGRGDSAVRRPMGGALDWRRVCNALARLYVDGARLDWDVVEHDTHRPGTRIPTSPFLRRRFWSDRLVVRDLAVHTPPIGGAGERLSAVISSGTTPESAAEPVVPAGGSLTPESLQEVSPEERHALLADELARGLTGLLGSKPTSSTSAGWGSGTAALDLDVPLVELGVDSLMAMAIKKQIKNQLGVVIPLTSVMGAGSVRSIATQVLDLLEREAVIQPAGTMPVATDAPDDDLVSRLLSLPESEARALLDEMETR